MFSQYLQKSLTSINSSRSQLIFWFSLSLAFAAFCGIIMLKTALSSDYAVSDDVRQHVFWMQRFVNPRLFPDDLVTDYFQSLSPLGYITFYRLLANIGVEPIFLSKLLPLILGLITTAYCFGISMQLLAIPAAAFLSTFLLNQNLWLASDLSSSTPRAFLYPFFLAFIYYLLHGSLLSMLLAIALLGLFYPSTLLVAIGVLIIRLVSWKNGRLRLTRKRQNFIFCISGLGVAFISLLPYFLSTNEFGSMVTAAQARMMPEFLQNGRTEFFVDNPVEYWLFHKRSGFVPIQWYRATVASPIKFLLHFPQIWMGLLLPILIGYPQRFTLVSQISRIVILPQIFIVSFGLFLAAHGVLFKLYLPSRFPQHSLQIIMPIAGAIAVIMILDALLNWAIRTEQTQRQVITIAITALLFVVIILYPSYWRLKATEFPHTGYVIGKAPKLYEFLSEQPENIIIASLAQEADNLPTFAQRSVLVSKQSALPYHLGYYRQILPRINDLLSAQYSQDATEVKNFVKKYDVDFWLLERTAFTPEYFTTHKWLDQRQFEPKIKEIAAGLQQGNIPALKKVVEKCSVLKTQDLILLKAQCF
ncbi:MAG: hypothetical protein HC836_08565 [Richelia sp. RM2_1_2]|nr:hypothetical protein [Richelia sp. SM2_1_7]NJM20729.1 hypothetical protein [Richelia sp. SM1_7_0]NJO28304.1 hypothetical protein [Richelia sp. SL_2_1]NJO58395.1 hypothetical protein [Richelia sp. RM2_1_2]